MAAGEAERLDCEYAVSSGSFCEIREPLDRLEADPLKTWAS